MERHRRDLEGKAGQDEHQAEQQADARRGRQVGLEQAEVGGAAETVDERDAVQQHARGKRAQHEIFEAGLRRARLAAMEGGEDIGGERLELQPDVERQQVVGRHHDRHAERREDEQDGIFEARAVRGAQVGQGEQRGDGGADVDQRLEEGGIGVGDVEAAECLARRGRLGDQRQRRQREQGDGRPGDQRQPPVAPPRPEQEQEERAGGQPDFRRGDAEGLEDRLHHLASVWSGTTCCEAGGRARSTRARSACTGACSGRRKLAG